MTSSTSHPLSIDAKVAVVGAGSMGIGIAQVAAAAGHAVVLYDNAENAATNALEGLKQRLYQRVERDKMTQDQADTLCARITATAVIDQLHHCKLVIEAIIEDLPIKQMLFKTLETICTKEAIFASNTSSLSISALASQLDQPERVVGMHFFNPAPVLALVEVVSGLQTAQSVASKVYATAKAWGKSPVNVKSSPGFIVNRVARPFYAEGLRSLNEGLASVPTIDAIMRGAGNFKLGPFELTDLIGQDVNLAVTQSVYNAYYQDQRFQPSPIQEELVTAGLLGRKTGQGFYNYSSNAQNSVVQDKREEPQKPPQQVTFFGDLNTVTFPIYSMLKQTTISIEAVNSSESYIDIDGCRLQLTDGRLASQCAQESGQDNLVLFDLALNFEKANSIALAPAAQASKEAINSAIGFWQTLNKTVYLIKDIPGMQVMRTACMLINEAADTVNQGVCSAEDIDIAMCEGVAYPIGPFHWSENIGIDRIISVLNHMAAIYGDTRYRCSPLLQAAQASGLSVKALYLTQNNQLL